MRTRRVPETALSKLASPLTDAIETPSELGPLWTHATDEVMTPFIRATGCWEPHLASYLRRRLRKGMRFLDVGANIGFFSVLGSRLVGETGAVVAVEPLPEHLDLLRANLFRHGCSNAVVLAIAAWNERRHLPMTTNRANPAGSHLAGPTNELLVPCGPLVEFLDRPFDVVKVDAEGSDPMAIVGLKELLAPGRTSLIVEYWPHRPTHYGDADETLSLYESLELGSLCRLDQAGEPVPVSREHVRQAEAEYFELVITPAETRRAEHRARRFSRGIIGRRT